MVVRRMQNVMYCKFKVNGKQTIKFSIANERGEIMLIAHSNETIYVSYDSSSGVSNGVYVVKM